MGGAISLENNSFSFNNVTLNNNYASYGGSMAIQSPLGNSSLN